MAYTPELDETGSAALRRIAWALDAPMTRALDMIISHMGRLLDGRRICEKCRDKSKCQDCLFGRPD